MATLKASASQTIIDMTDGFTVSLSQDSAAWNGGVSNLGTAQNVDIVVSAYQGASVATYSVGTPTCSDTANCTATVSGTTVKVTVKAAATKGGTVTIPVTCGPSGSSVVINKTFSYSIALKGEKGSTGTAVTVKSTEVTYASSTSTTQPTSGWSTDMPAVAAGSYLWTKTVVTYTDNKSTTTYSYALQGETGQKGTSVTVSSTAVTYGTSTSASTQPSSWDTNMPDVAEGSYLWTKTVVTYSDGKSTTTYSYAKQGEKGEQGNKGDAGNDAILLVITYDTMTLRNNTGSATMTAHVYVGGVEATVAPETGVVTFNGKTLGTVKWYVGGATTGGTASGTFEASASSITNQQTYTAQLEA